MTSEEELRLKLRKIEALFEGPGTAGERNAAGAARERIKERLAQAVKDGPPLEYTFKLEDQWSRQLFTALCRRYALEPYRYARQKYTTVMVRVPECFCDEVLWPHYQALSKELKQYLTEATAKIISEEVHRDTREAPEIVQLLEAG
jgi:tRNA nucleotidyltransferase (CCA-adding enzyme)